MMIRSRCWHVIQNHIYKQKRCVWNTKMKLFIRLTYDAPYLHNLIILPFTRKYNQRFDFLCFYWWRIGSDNNHEMMINSHSNWTNSETRVHYPKSVSLSWSYVEGRHRKKVQKTFFEWIKICVISCTVFKFYVQGVGQKGVFKITSSSIDHNPTWCSFLSIPMH